jgi:hypothetical protein
MLRGLALDGIHIAPRQEGKAPGSHSWDVDENDAGQRIVVHTHAAERVPGYFISQWNGGFLAQCSRCMAYLVEYPPISGWPRASNDAGR